MKRLLPLLGAAMLACGLIFTASSCEKDNGKYELTVVITANDSVRVQNALVRVYAPVNNTAVDYFYNTDEEGEVHLTFDNKVIVEIQVSKGSYKACGFAEVNRGENKVTVDLKPFNDIHNGC